MVSLNQVAARAGGGARDPEVPRRQPRARAGGSEAGGVRAERRLVDVAYDADKETATSARRAIRSAACMSERRTKEEWELLLAMHRGYYPLVDNQPMNDGQGFRRGARADRSRRRRRRAARQPPPDGSHHRASVEGVPAADAGMDGVGGGDAAAEAGGPVGDLRLRAGKGPVFGQVTVTADPADARYVHHRDALHVRAQRRDGHAQGKRASSTPASSGAAAWHGRAGDARRSDDRGARVLCRRAHAARDVRPLVHRRYDETGIDVKLVQVGATGRARRQHRRAQDRRRRAPASRSLRREPAARPDRRTSASARASRCRASSRRRPTP